jgi:putative ATP-binding cassette transporter
MLNASFTIVAFSGVLWSISPPLFGVAVAYAAGGSLLTVVLGRPLVWLNYNQSDKEAVFRADLLHVRENAEWVALSHREEVLRGRLLRHLGELADNFRRIIAVSRNLGFFTTGYNYLIQIIPALIVAPLFIRGQVEFGVITQAAIGFTQLLGAFSIVVNQFQSISSYAAVLTRLAALAEAIEEVESPTPRPAVEVVEDDTRVAYERLTLRSTENGQPLVRDLSVAVLRGTNCLIVGPDEAAKTALFRATAGVRDSGEGRIVRPPLDQIFFLPERPYLPPGTLRELLWGGGRGPDGSDEAALPVWRTVRLDEVAARVGGLDVEHDWDEVLSLGEQHFLAVARSLIVAPRFVFLDRISNVLGPEQIDEILNRLAAASITYLVIGTAEDRPDRYEAVLELARDGTWRWQPRRVARAVGESLHSDR